MKGLYLGALLCIAPLLAPAQDLNSEEFMEQLLFAMGNPEDRARLKEILGAYTTEEKRSMADQIATAVIPHLPIRTDSNTTTTGMVIGTSSLGLTIEISDASVLDGIETRGTNYVCTTPVYIILLMMNYEVMVSYYNPDGAFLKQLQYTSDTCAF